MSSSNRPIQKKDEQSASSVPTALSSPKSKKSSDSSYSKIAKEIARESGRILIVGGGVATALYPLDLSMQYFHTKNATPSESKNGLSGSGRAPLPKWTSAIKQGLNFSAARTLARGYASSTQAAVLKNAALSQRGKVTDAFVDAEEKFEESHRKATPLQMGGAAGLIGLVDTTLTQKMSNDRAWHIHAFFLKQQNLAYKAPAPQTLYDSMRLYFVGYPLRLTRNTGMVGGLLASTYLEDQMKLSATFSRLSDKQRSFAAATTVGAFTGFFGNIIDIGYKNQVILVNPDTLTAPSARETFGKLVAEGGKKALTRGFGTSIFYTVVAYNVVPYMENVADKTVPQIEQALTVGYASVSGLFGGRKPPKGPSAGVQAQSSKSVDELSSPPATASPAKR